MKTKTNEVHTPGPWAVDHEVISASGAHISMAIGPDTATYAEQVANAARIVACVNACEGLHDPVAALRDYKVARTTDLLAQNELLRSALTGTLAALDAAATGATLTPPSGFAQNIRAQARAALSTP